MEAAIYDDFNVYSPFDFDIKPDPTIVESEYAPVAIVDSLDSLYASSSNISSSADVLPSDIHTKDVTYSFGVQYVHETDLWDSSLAHLTRQSKFHFAPRRISAQSHKPASPVDKMLGTNTCPLTMHVVLIKEHIDNLKIHSQVLADDMCVLRMVLQQLSKEGWSLANNMDLQRSLLVSSEQRLAFIAPRVPLVADDPSQVYIKYITFEYGSENTNSKIRAPTKSTCTIRFPVVQFSGLFPDRAVELIVTGERPSTNEVNRIQETLQIAEPVYRKLGQNICVLESLTDRMEMEFSNIRQEIFLHSVLLAPVNRIPGEVLMEMFSHCFHIAEVSPVSESGPVLVPFVLGAVNSRWRSVVKSLPHLWSAIRVHLNVTAHPSYALKILLAWLERSGTTSSLSLKN
ncbi:hypothetical protein J3R30DRAFT_1048143 [Lentinula aciculospora]|uniref:F-box domain-containing protein n=1 Tax=Lentinula aciculospora TaxID=153920 RepID=A0A9W9DIH5_9AGAR|nr:hypothetical protein J3R30DRAFT_1048143 [Lentinula aciculospora]